MKYVVLAIALMAVPVLAGWLRRNPQHKTKIWFAMGLLPFVVTTGAHPLYIAVISWAEWPGYVKGAEFTAIDVLALAIFLSQPATRHWLPFLYSIVFYFIAVLFSALMAQVPMASLFFAWQLIRIFLVFFIVTRACSDERNVSALLTGMAIGICLEVVSTVWQRFGLGVLQTGGTVGEKNLLGLMSQFVGMPWFALLLAGRRGKMPVLGALGSVITSVMTVSRAALGLNVAGMAIVFALSAIRKWTPRKAKIALLGAVAFVVIAPIAYWSFESRFSSELPDGGYDERAAFQNAAKMMLSEHPLGVGANNYVVVANVGGYDARAHVADTYGSLSTNVHNAYLLVAAETGYFGLLAFVILLLRPLIVAFRCGWRSRKDPRGDLLLGLGAALLTVYIHCFFEWIFLTFLPMYLFAMTTGLVAGLAQQLGYWGHVQSSAERTNSAGVGTNEMAINRRITGVRNRP